MQDTHPHVRTTAEQVEDWREIELVSAGYPADAAIELSRRADVDLHQAVALLANGCALDVALDILR